MNLKLLIQLITPFSFNFVYCFKDSVYLQERYTEIRKNAQIIHLLNVVMCRDMEVNIKERLQVCQRIFKLLRDDTTIENPYRHSLYMNYNVFKLSSTDPKYPVCQETNVKINMKPTEKYLSMNCYGRSPINSEISENNQYLKEISFFNGANRTIMVLKCLQSDANCELLESYDHKEWYKFSDIPDYVFYIPVPRTADIQKLKSIFTVNVGRIGNVWANQSNLMNRFMTGAEFEKLCHLLLGRSKYVDKCRPIQLDKKIPSHPTATKSDITIFEPFVTIQQLHTNKKQLEERTLNLNVFSCSQYTFKGKRTKTFKIMADPHGRTSVMLIEPTQYKNEIRLVPVELIENLHWDYVLNIEHWF